jgi:hypothetical protein
MHLFYAPIGEFRSRTRKGDGYPYITAGAPSRADAGDRGAPKLVVFSADYYTSFVTVVSLAVSVYRILY